MAKSPLVEAVVELATLLKRVTYRLQRAGNLRSPEFDELHDIISREADDIIARLGGE